MNILNIIDKKKNKKVLTKEELKYAFMGYLNKKIPAYQMSSLLMAITLNDMTDEEAIDLTEIFIESGDFLDLSPIKKPKVDKHSTGGVGDKVTLVIAPLVASCHVCVPKLSGRGLGHTGGTIDKLESIPGFNINLTEKEFIDQLKTIDVAISSQTDNLTPLDKVIYALRDVTGTVESIPLIAVSIMSKKIAIQADEIIIDLKLGAGALIKNSEDAIRLANLMKKIGKKYDKEVRTIISDMSHPLGMNVGNALEVIEAMDVLQNKTSGEIKDTCVQIAANMVSMGLKISYDEAAEMVNKNLSNGLAYQKFLELVKMQGGDISKLKIEAKQIAINSKVTGTIKQIKALEIGKLSHLLGAGRNSLDQKLDYSAGIILNKKTGDSINKDELLCTLFTNKEINLDIETIIKNCFEIEEH